MSPGHPHRAVPRKAVHSLWARTYHSAEVMRRLGPMNDELRAVAESQGGVFTTRQAHAAGYDKWGLLRLVHQSTCEHLARSVYAVPPSRERTDVDCHLLLARGNLLLYPDARL